MRRREDFCAGAGSRFSPEGAGCGVKRLCISKQYWETPSYSARPFQSPRISASFAFSRKSQALYPQTLALPGSSATARSERRSPSSVHALALSKSDGSAGIL